MTARRPRTRAIRLSRRWTRIGKLIGYPLFGLLVFVATVYLSLPLDRIKERLERELSQESGPPYAAATTGAWGIGTGMDVRISELDLHLLPVGVSATGVTLHPRKPFGSPIAPPAGAPPSSGEDPDKAKTMFVDSLRISVPVFDLLFGKQAASLRVEAFGGTLTGSGGLGSDGGEMEGALENLVLARIPGLGQLLPLPMTGTLTLRADGRAPAQKPPASAPPPAQKGGKAPPPRLDLAKAQGQLEIHLDQGTLGDGKAKLKVPGDPFLSQGLTFPKLLLGNLAGKLTVDRGRATFDQVHSRSADAEIWLDGYVELRDPFPQSELHLYLRFKPSAALIAREPTMEILSNAMAAGKRPDGALGFAVTGSLAVPRSRPAKDPPTGVTASVSMGKVEPSARPSMNPGAPAYSPPQVSVATPVPPPPPPPTPTPAPVSEPTPPVIVRAAEPPPPPPPPAQLPTPPPIPEQQAAPRPEPERKEEARKEPDGVNAPEPPPNFPTNQRGF